METITEGAEATITRDDGRITKDRKRKEYRHPSLDERLRTERTEQEIRLLQKARQAGVKVPEAEKEGDSTLAMERVEGEVLKEVFENQKDAWDKIGDSVARLHARNIIHGDLTTSNMIWKDGELYLIDFGLGFFSERVEDRATDLHLLSEVLESTHSDVADEAMEQILDAYMDAAEDADAVLERYDAVAGRGRYRG